MGSSLICTSAANNGLVQRSNDDNEEHYDPRRKSSETTPFESSFWPTMISTLFNTENKSNGIECGIIFIPKEKPIAKILKSTFKGSKQCKVPVTKQFLKQYTKSQQSNPYIITHAGYIIGHDISTADIKKNNKNQTIYQLAAKNGFIIIDSQKHQTRRSKIIYSRIYINNIYTKSSDSFCNELKQCGINVNLDNDHTTTWKSRSSMDISSTFANNSAQAVAAKNLAQCIFHLQSQRTNKENPEKIGATIVVIPYNKSLKDFEPYLKRYEGDVDIEVKPEALLSIFKHDSVLHDGAIFIRGDTIIAVSAIFRMNEEYKENISIKHGTRHASAQEFSKKSKLHKSITFVLSEEDGKIRACINGNITKVNHERIQRLIVENYYYKLPCNKYKLPSTNSPSTFRNILTRKIPTGKHLEDACTFNKANVSPTPMTMQINQTGRLTPTTATPIHSDTYYTKTLPSFVLKGESENVEHYNQLQITKDDKMISDDDDTIVVQDGFDNNDEDLTSQTRQDTNNTQSKSDTKSSVNDNIETIHELICVETK